MKQSIKIAVFFIITFGLVLFGSSETGFVLASRNNAIITLTPTPIPSSIKLTPTVDQASIGDTSGVIAIGLIVVFIILAGVVWGSLELHQESLRTRMPKE